MQYHNGFSLIEMLIVVAIIGILSAICIPAYSEHVLHEKRLEATLSLTKLSLALEQYYTMHNTYKTATLASLGLEDKIAHSQYQLIIASATDSDYKLEAKPLANQAIKDTQCATLTLSSSGEKGITGLGTIQDCW